MSAEKKMNRREFIIGAAVAGAGLTAAGAIAGCSKAATPTPGLPAKWDYETDVVVVGFGAAGGAAAIEAADAGAKVIVLEKTNTPGGSSCLCAGILYAAGTTLQKAAGITDTPDEMYKYLMSMGNGMNVPELTRIQADNSAPAFEWLVKLGAQFYSGVNLYGGIPAIQPLADDKTSWGLYYSGAEPEMAKVTPPKPRGHIVKPVQPTWTYPPKNPSAPTPVGPTRGTGFFKPLWEGVKSRGLQVLVQTRATELVVDPTTKQVVGVKATQPATSLASTDASGTVDYANGKTVYIKAKRGVVLSAGGHSQNKDFNKIYCQEGIYPTNYTASDTGDGIIMGMKIGAGTINLDQTLLSVSVLAGAIMVDPGGRRFVDETFYAIKAEGWKGASGRSSNWLAWEIGDKLIKGTSTATVVEAPTIKELAVKIGCDPTVLDQTVNFYNQSVAGGVDLEFGKTRITRAGDVATKKLVPISTPPFYAIKKDHASTASSQGITIGGLRINTKAQVVSITGTDTIPRLYAAGINGGGIMGDCYTGSGSAIGQDLVWGRIAGKNAAGEAPLT
ncbi:MAG: FAD-dependent oxidoreductase [Coriobacteriia bacterium]|nr:FAD-dependent oxidoreductase [Coriobacteriia bacterium]